MKAEDFCKKHKVTIDQFYGREKIGGDLDLGSVTSLPENFNPTVGGYLYLRSLTSIPEGFNPTVGGYLHWNNGNSKKYIGATVSVKVERQRNFIWEKYGKKFALVDGIFCEVINEKSEIINNEEVKIFSAKKVNKEERFFIANKGTFFAHGKELKQAFSDLEFKIVAEKLKNEPIHEDTPITVQHYRLATGACDMGCRDFMDRNKIPYTIDDGRTIESEPIKAKDLLKILEK